MRLTTKIYDANGKTVNYSFSTCSGETLMGGYRTEVYLYIHGEKVGHMQYSIKENYLYIHRMYNYTVMNSKIDTKSPYKHIGKVFFEYAFHKSLKAGKKGAIELDAIHDSPAAYYKMGFRKKAFAAVWLEELLTKYTKTKSLKTKLEIQATAIYNELKKTAARKLNKDISCVTFDEAITNAIYSIHNDEFAEVLAKKSANNEQISEGDCIRLRMNGTMYLPEETIIQKKIDFLHFIPVGCNSFFSRDYALNNLKYEKLKKLVSDNKLDSCNAVEIQAKMTETDPSLDLLLSKIGLQMMKRNYISGWYIGVYFNNIDKIKAIVSENGLRVFENGFVQYIGQLTSLSSETLGLLLSNSGISLLEKGDIFISESGYIKDRAGNYLDPTMFKGVLIKYNSSTRLEISSSTPKMNK